MSSMKTFKVFMKPNFHIWYFKVILYFETRWLSWATSFSSKSRRSCFIDRRNLECYIFLYPNMSGAWIQARRADDVRGCVYELVLCELVLKWVSRIANFLQVILRKGAIHTCTTATKSMEGTASFFSHLDLNKEVSSVSFKFKSARCPTRNMPIYGA